jgi:hypothetical protein
MRRADDHPSASPVHGPGPERHADHHQDGEPAAKMLYDQNFHGKNIAEIPSALMGTKAPSLNLPPLEGSILPALTDEASRAS